MLKYFHLRKLKRHEAFSLWSPFAAPYGVLLSVLTMLLIIPSGYERVAMLPVFLLGSKDDLSSTGSAYLTIHASRNATFTSCEQIPGKDRTAHALLCIKQDFGVVPGEPIPKEILKLASTWRLVTDRAELQPMPNTPLKPYLAKDRQTRSKTHPLNMAPIDPRPGLLISERYRASLDWNGIREALRLWRTRNPHVDVLMIEVEDEVPTDTVTRSIDLCIGMHLRPLLSTQKPRP
jgi:hypothetical protein